MIITQVRFRSEGEDISHGGILVEVDDDSYVICGCCGSIFEMDEIQEMNKIESWIDINDAIIGQAISP